MQTYISKCITCIETVYIAGTNRDWFHYVLLWSNRVLCCTAQHSQHSVRMMSAKSAAFPQLTASCNCVTATCYVNRPVFHHQYLSECLHTEGITEPPYYTQLIRLYIVKESPALTLHAGHTDRPSTTPSEDTCACRHGQAEPNNHRYELNGLANWNTRQEESLAKYMTHK